MKVKCSRTPGHPTCRLAAAGFILRLRAEFITGAEEDWVRWDRASDDGRGTQARLAAVSGRSQPPSLTAALKCNQSGTS